MDGTQKRKKEKVKNTCSVVKCLIQLYSHRFRIIVEIVRCSSTVSEIGFQAFLDRNVAYGFP